MVTFECVKVDGDIHTYRYYPEGDKGHPGEFVVNKNSGEVIDCILSDKDKIIKWYFHHALSKVQDGEESGMAAWY